MPTVRVFNPHRRRRARRRNRRNPGASELFVVGNPKHMAAHRRRKNRRRRINRHRNPVLASSRRRRTNRHFRRRHNPLSFKKDAILALWASVGGIATRMGVQTFLANYNSGVQGYAANAAVALALGWVADKFSETAGTGVLVGGLSATVLRIVGDFVKSKNPQAQSAAAMSGLSGDTEFALGDFQSSYFFEPSVNTGSNQTVVPPPFAAYLPPPAPTKSKGLSGYGMGAPLERFASRWS
jgi:hypothetical protein